MEKGVQQQGIEGRLSNPQAHDGNRLLMQALTPSQLIQEYARQKGVPESTLAEAIRIMGEDSVAAVAGHAPPVSLEMHRVGVRGFGPFREPCEYDLASGGLRMICGDNRDDLQADR